jgi:hypothetical protein
MNKELRSLLNYRQQGSTSALVGVLKANKNAKILVHSYTAKRDLIKNHDIPDEQILSVENLSGKLVGLTGPVVVDIPAIAKLADNSDMLRFLYTQLPTEFRQRYGDTYEEFVWSLTIQQNLLSGK